MEFFYHAGRKNNIYVEWKCRRVCGLRAAWRKAGYHISVSVQVYLVSLFLPVSTCYAHTVWRAHGCSVCIVVCVCVLQQGLCALDVITMTKTHGTVQQLSLFQCAVNRIKRPRVYISAVASQYAAALRMPFLPQFPSQFDAQAMHALLQQYKVIPGQLGQHPLYSTGKSCKLLFFYLLIQQMLAWAKKSLEIMHVYALQSTLFPTRILWKAGIFKQFLTAGLLYVV